MAVRGLLRAWLIALAILPLGALAAQADDGRPPSPEGAGRPPTSPRVPLSGLRPSEIETRAIPSPTSDPGLEPPADLRRAIPGSARELVLFVGGYGSRADDGAFDALAARFPADRYDVRRFGTDPRFRYDTYGPIDQSAAALTDEIRSRAPRYAAVNIVSHSMGGTVVDRAFSNGLSSSDGVRTYVALAGAHNGADMARAPSAILPLIAPVKDIIRAAATILARDPDSPAARDLATARPIPPPPGVVRLDLSLATDGFVNRHDAHDPGVEQRVFLPGSPGELIDGHGGSLTNREIGDVVVAVIRDHRPPPDRRDQFTVFAAPLLWERSAATWRLLLLAMVTAGVALWLARFVPGWGRLVDRVNAMCGRFLQVIGR